MYNHNNRHNRRNAERPETSADRIRRRVEQLDEQRRNMRPKINPFTLVSIGVVLVLLIVAMNLMGGY